MRWLIVLVAALVSLSTEVGHAAEGDAESVEIPLNAVWAYDMPGTRELSDGMRNGKFVADEGPLILAIRKGPFLRTRRDEKPKPAFAVQGVGMEALDHAQTIMTGKEEPQSRFPGASDLSIVFFSTTTPAYVHIDRVTLGKNVIDISFHFIPHETRELTEHFAIIPVGQLSAGSHDVRIVQLPISEENITPRTKEVDLDWQKKFICRPFSFEVDDRDSR